MRRGYSNGTKEVSLLNRDQKIVKALLTHAKGMGDWVRPTKLVRKLRGSTANAFLLGVMFDRSVKAEQAWESADWINDSLGDPGDVAAIWNRLTKMEARRVQGFLRFGYGGFAFHRHYKTFAKQLPQAAHLLLEKYDGDPRRIWNNKRDVSLVRERLEEIPGIGPALSRMAVLILARNHGLLGGTKALSQLDIKPDIHVKRVFKRCGFINTFNDIEAIDAAQRLHPLFPAALDAPAFEIGRTWCRPTNPNCKDCAIRPECRKLV